VLKSCKEDYRIACRGEEQKRIDEQNVERRKNLAVKVDGY
jgi:hypothetical protein